MRAFKGSSEIVDDLRDLDKVRTAVSTSFDPQECLAQLKTTMKLPKGFAPTTKPLTKAKRRKRT